MTPKILYDQQTNQWYRPEDGKPEPAPLTKCHKCGAMTSKHKQQAYGDSWTCQDPNCHATLYLSIGD